jgi:flagellar protein FliS
MIKRLMLGHIKNDIEPLEEVLGLLQELHAAWKAIDTVGHAPPANAALHPLAA